MQYAVLVPLAEPCVAEHCSRYSDSLRAGRSGIEFRWGTRFSAPV